MDTSLFISILGAAGIGGIIGSYFQTKFTRKNEIFLKLNSINEERYKSLLYHMNIILNPENAKFMNHADPKSDKQFNVGDHFAFIRAEYLQSVLYAPDDVVIALKTFIESPTEINFIDASMKMRKSLWSKKTKLKINDILISEKVGS